jgi:hypothetical protein
VYCLIWGHREKLIYKIDRLQLLDHQHKLFVYVDIRKGISCLLSFVIVFFLLSINNAAAQQQQQGLQQSQPQTTQGLPLVFIPAFTGNILAVVSFLIGTSSFILGLRMQSAARTTTESSSSSTLPLSTMHKYFELLILALVIPAIGLNTYGILVLASHLYPSDSPYLSLLFVLFIPAGAILFLVSKLRIAYKTNA